MGLFIVAWMLQPHAKPGICYPVLNHPLFYKILQNLSGDKVEKMTMDHRKTVVASAFQRATFPRATCERALPSIVAFAFPSAFVFAFLPLSLPLSPSALPTTGTPARSNNNRARRM